LVFDHTNWLQTITHTYQENTVDCETVVTLTAENECNIIQGGNSQATFNPIRIWDYDDAAITPSDFVLCWPENTVTYTNTTERNCLFQGNISPRYEYWNFGDHWGLGYDSIIDWTPWPPTFPQTLSYPAIGDYSVMMLDSNFCGIDTAYVTISIVPPPSAGISSSADTICEGEAVTFFNNSSAEANAWLIDFDEGGGWVNMGAASATNVFETPGDYEIGLVAYVAGAGATCTDTVRIPLHVRPGPVADFTMSDDEACDSLRVSFVNNSVDAFSYAWDFGNGNTHPLANPPDQDFTNVGTYFVSLQVVGTNGCSDVTSQTVTIHSSPEAVFSTLDVCLGDTASFIDGSTALPAEPITTWNWDFGNGDSSTDTLPRYAFPTGGLYDVTLTVSTDFCSDDTLISINVDIPPVADFRRNRTAVGIGHWQPCSSAIQII
jgi:PKD repeat protein